ncbi:hypothetical protein [Salinarimonas soli]|uniref:Uncharacterized protein n=1 Tax=Salinarimonas soli TaxID=1638099 RepID=A0A5B2VB82_9HYPH|nr:hypothetical protein [Salinarimonas soli]KAA2235589.1 hypothetical protein F0L46_18995 [Salinarimonas soli]
MTDVYDPSELRQYRARKRAQRRYQADYRERLKVDGIPERDDVAAAALRVVLRALDRNPAAWETLRVGLLNEIARAGFTRAHAAERLDAMVARQARQEARERGRKR